MKTCWITYNLVMGALMFRGDCVVSMPNGRLTESFLKDVKGSIKQAVLDKLSQQGAVPEDTGQEVLILACIPLDEEEPNPLVVVPPTGEAWENPNDAL